MIEELDLAFIIYYKLPLDATFISELYYYLSPSMCVNARE
jgi:hypothetical protein